MTLNLVAWLAAIVPALFSKTPADLLAGTGLTTNPVYVQDLAFWLLLVVVAGAWLLRRKVWGYVIAGSMLTLWVFEIASVALDQWYGHAADPASAVTSGDLAWAFSIIAIAGLGPAHLLLPQHLPDTIHIGQIARIRKRSPRNAGTPKSSSAKRWAHLRRRAKAAGIDLTNDLLTMASKMIRPVLPGYAPSYVPDS